MYCPQCAAQLVDSDKFCRACGADLKAAAMALAKQPLSSKAGRKKNKEPKKEKTPMEKRSKGVRDAVEGSIMIVATLLVGVPFFLSGSNPARMAIWAGIFGWIAIWGIFSLASGLGAIMEAASMVTKAVAPQPADNLAPVPDTDPLDNSGISPLLSVTENTTRSLEPAPQKYAVKE
jgi:zinc ribbon protein